jgi:MoaA/NifB/PqqE/SkfB family radical SAM enzyme
MPPGLEEVNVVGGGEPLIHPEIIGILRAVKRRGLRGSLITNGTLLKEDKARAIIDMRWDYVRVSVHAGDRETFKAVHGVDRFEILLENLKTLARLRAEASARSGGGPVKPRTAVLHVLQPANIGSIDKLFAFGEAAGVDEMIFEKVVALDPSLRLSAEDYRRGAEALKSCAAASKVPCNIDEILGQMRLGEACEAEGKPFRPGRCCTVGFDQSYVNSMGEIFPCCFSNEKMGDLKEASFRDIWFGPKYSAFRKRLAQGKFAKYCIENRCAIRAVLQD